MQLSAEEFLGRFLLHVLPKRFVRIRHYGLLAGGNVPTRLRCPELLHPSMAETELTDRSPCAGEAAATGAACKGDLTGDLASHPTELHIT